LEKVDIQREIKREWRKMDMQGEKERDRNTVGETQRWKETENDIQDTQAHTNRGRVRGKVIHTHTHTQIQKERSEGETNTH
jgi:hypothetical protein